MYLFNRIVLIIICLLTFNALAQATEKNPEDPTKIITKLGVSYNDEFAFSGSIGIGPVSKINGRINEDASEWRLGGSWLFNFGIINVNFSRTEFDGDAYKKNYSVGSFLPLSALGIPTGKWQIFPMAGFNHTDGKNYFAVEEPDLTNNYVLLPSSSNGGYIGVFMLRPLNEQWTFISFLGGSKGSDSYSGTWGGIGIGYRITDNQSLNSTAFASDDDYGRVEKISFGYKYEFGKGTEKRKN